MADIVLINPRFEASYWGFEYAIPLLGRKANLPVACLPLLAALTPPPHRVTLIDDAVDYFDRADSLYLDPDFQFNRAQKAYGRKHPVRGGIEQLKMLVRCGVLYRRLMKTAKEPELRQEHRRRLSQIWRTRRQPAALYIYVLKCAIHYHYQQITKRLVSDDARMVNTF